MNMRTLGTGLRYVAVSCLLVSLSTFASGQTAADKFGIGRSFNTRYYRPDGTTLEVLPLDTFSVEFDNTDGLLHNARGNFLAAERNGQFWNVATNGSGVFQSLRGSRPDLDGTGGVSVSPDNTRVAHTVASTFASGGGHLFVLDYDNGATPGTGTGAVVHSERFVSVFGLFDGAVGTTWLDDQTVLVFDPVGNLYGVDDIAGILSAPVVLATFTTPGTGTGEYFTDVEYNPVISPYVYCMYGSTTGFCNAMTGVENKLYVLDPDTWSLVGTWDYNTSIGTGAHAQEIAFDSAGSLLISQRDPAPAAPDWVIDIIPNASDPATLTDNNSLDFPLTPGPVASCLVGLDVATTSSGKTLYGVTLFGKFLEVDTTTGAATELGNIGYLANAMASDPNCNIFTLDSTDELILVDPETATGSLYVALTGRPSGYGVTAMAFSPAGELYVILSHSDTAMIDKLGRINRSTGAYTVIGDTGLTTIQGLAFSPGGTLYGIGNMGLCSIDTSTGVATVIGGSGHNNDWQALEFAPDGRAYAARDDLNQVDPATGNATAIGPTGFDIRGLAFGRKRSATPSCPGDLDGDGLVNLTDLALLLSDFDCSGGGCPGDADGDGDTDLTDLAFLLANFDMTCN